MSLWFPIGYKFYNNVLYKKPIFENRNWQIFKSDKFNVLIAKKELMELWKKFNLIEDGEYNLAHFNNQEYMILLSEKRYFLQPVYNSPRLINDTDAISFAMALKNSKEKVESNKLSFANGIFVEKYSVILPVEVLKENISDEYIVSKWITGGVKVPLSSTRRIEQLTKLNKQTINKIAELIGMDVTEKNENKIISETFQLPGRPKLEKFFIDYVIDIVINKDKYERLGIKFPSAIVLYGPPGSGKTYAVEKLTNFLNWPLYTIEASTIASPYIHETSRKIAQIFEEAMKNSPSILIIDEMEAFLSDRNIADGHHNIEEMAEFLKKIPVAIENNVLIIAMTNKLEMIDPAILRKGRFDHILRVDYAKADEVESMLKAQLLDIPIEKNVDLKYFSKKLQNRPLSDVAFFIKESARIAAKNNKHKIDKQSFEEALNSIINFDDNNMDRKENSKKLGFI